MLQNFLTHFASENRTALFAMGGVLALSSGYRLRAAHIYDIQSDVFFSFRRAFDSRRGVGVSG